MSGVSEGDGDDGPLVAIAAGAVTFLTFGVAFGLLALGWSFFWIAFPIGFGGLLPLTVQIVRYYRHQQERASATLTDAGVAVDDEREEALATLREQYAAGKLDEEEFEARLERLLETETVADAERFRGEDAGTESDRDLEHEIE